MDEFDDIELDQVRPGVLVARLDRPARLNALTFAMFDQLRELAADVHDREDIRALVLTGAGRGFCAGLDLDDAAGLATMSAPEMLSRQEGWAAAISAFCKLRQPVIAAVNGPAAGAGMALALAADIRLAAPSAVFNAAFVKIGLSGGDVGVSWTLPRIVGLGRAAEILFTGRLFDAAHAERIGLVNEVVPAEELLARALDLAEEIAANSPFGIRLTKQVLRANVDAPSIDAAIELENRNQVLTTRTADMPAALRAFRAGEAPRFDNR